MLWGRHSGEKLWMDGGAAKRPVVIRLVNRDLALWYFWAGIVLLRSVDIGAITLWLSGGRLVGTGGTDRKYGRPDGEHRGNQDRHRQ